MCSPPMLDDNSDLVPGAFSFKCASDLDAGNIFMPSLGFRFDVTVWEHFGLPEVFPRCLGEGGRREFNPQELTQASGIHAVLD